MSNISEVYSNSGAFRKLVLDKTADDIYKIIEAASRFMTPEEVAELKKRYFEMWDVVFPDQMCICNHTEKHHMVGVCRNLRCECIKFEVKE